MRLFEPMRPWPDDWSHLWPHHYNLIEADPPWRFEHYSERGWGKSAEGQYETMSTEAIQELPVADLADVSCLLLLWARNPMVDVAVDTMRAWGFRFASFLYWAKVSHRGKRVMGTGYRVRNCGELVLLGTRGNPIHRSFKSDFIGVRREHSRKPEELFRLIDLRAPKLTRRCSLFSRQTRPGWAVAGNQINLFDDEGDAHGRDRPAGRPNQGSVPEPALSEAEAEALRSELRARG